ncbi:MAG: DUF188 domain-containing protein [Lagierella massiliensis]|nr:DUF188 domain-containing protein [Lagierella massiliensis]
MIIYVDGDSCPVISIVKDISNIYNLNYLVISDYNHNLKVPKNNYIIVDSEKDEADFFIANRIVDGDFLITNDMGLAAMVLGKDVTVLNFTGDLIDKNNIDLFLFQRHVSKMERKNNVYNTKFKKRSKTDNINFRNSLIKFLNRR